MNVTWLIFSFNLIFFCSFMCDTWFKWISLFFIFFKSCFDPKREHKVYPLVVIAILGCSKGVPPFFFLFVIF